VSRQVYYRSIKSRKHKQIITQSVISLVQNLRTIIPKLGGRKLYFLLKDELSILKVGRVKLFRILKANHMLIKPKRSYYITTDSHHRFRKHKNLISALKIEKLESGLSSFDVTIF
tara:strand:- start:4116 stop:4460 length:345 start_codon:yes stop_codon:yes gene_type:complete